MDNKELAVLVLNCHESVIELKGMMAELFYRTALIGQEHGITFEPYREYKKTEAVAVSVTDEIPY